MEKVTRPFVLVASLALLAGCGRESIPRGEPHRLSSPIVGGTVDNGHPAVVLIYNSNQGYLCTGTLIDYRVILTAAHCVEDSSPSNYQVAGGTDPFEGADWVENAIQVAIHPDYDPQEIGVADVGIIVLAGDPPVEPIAWQKDVDHDVYAVGTTFTAVGYGVTSGGGGGDGVKRTVDLRITERYLDAFLYGESGKNTCSGDSGGPALRMLNGVETVIGVVSFGDANCSQYGADMRTDYNAAFISQYATGSGGPNPTPTPTPGGGGGGGGGGGDDDDDGGNPGDPAQEDDGYGLFGCRVATASSSLPLLPLLAFALLAFRRRA